MNRKELEELLPFFANGSLEGREREEVEKALHDCSDLREELDYLTSLRREMQETALEPGPGDLGLKRLQRAMADEDLRADPITRAQTLIAPEQNNRLWKIVAAAACLLLAIQTGLTLHMTRDRDLVAAGAQVVQSAKDAAFLVTFAPQTSEAAIREMLVVMNAEIIGGPSALGIYLVTGGDDPAATRDALENSSLVETIQEAGK
ncbi:MAG: zf-HC2 domain-containing protein [Alphaproteobacteria bacterium]|nr:zf-HC2 domain-containing protein [Alphaproteobacteria bacterium]